MKWMINKREEGMNIRDYLQQVRGLSRRILISVKKETGGILLNGQEATVRKQLQAGDELAIKLPEEQVSKWLFPQDIALSIVYEDEAVIVINKPPGMATLPSPKYKSGTVANALLGHYEKTGNPNTIHVVTRLDRDTSGLILIAKDRLSHSLLAKSQKQFEIGRKYITIVHGRIEEERGKIDAPIGRKKDSIVERMVTSEGKRAVTHYEVLQRWQDHSLVEAELETGRTHQIRVHFSHINHPLIGDDLYGGKTDLLTYQALHCCELTFTHPYSNEVHVLRAEPPEAFLRVKEELSQLNEMT